MPRTKKIVCGVLLLASFVVCFPISIRVADPFFTHPFRTGWQYQYPILLIWPDHVEMRWVHDTSELSPRSKDAAYAFNVEPERQAWVESTVRKTPAPNGNAAWVIHVTQLGPARQLIQLELLGDGITGIVYEARHEEILPLRSRLTGPAGAFVILAVQLLLWGGFWLLIWLCVRLLASHHKRHLQSGDVGEVSRIHSSTIGENRKRLTEHKRGCGRPTTEDGRRDS